MIKAIIFGGTTEGRKLCEFCTDNSIPILYCVATEDGAHPVETLRNVNAHIGRLNADEMAALFEQYHPTLVIDATHPYAQEASKNISDACGAIGIRLVRVTRESGAEQGLVACFASCSPMQPGCRLFSNMDDLISWLEDEPGNVFVTTGSSAAAAFTKLNNFQSRVWIRILPNLNSLNICLELGYRPERLICMQGPFSVELNCAMFHSANARILITKDSGAAGGFPEKIRAAQSLGMMTAVLSKPEETSEAKFEDACRILMELSI